jgi:hypothetical protein
MTSEKHYISSIQESPFGVRRFLFMPWKACMQKTQEQFSVEGKAQRRGNSGTIARLCNAAIGE